MPRAETVSSLVRGGGTIFRVVRPVPSLEIACPVQRDRIPAAFRIGTKDSDLDCTVHWLRRCRPPCVLLCGLYRSNPQPSKRKNGAGLQREVDKGQIILLYILPKSLEHPSLEFHKTSFYTESKSSLFT